MKLTKSIIDKLIYKGDAKKNQRCIYWSDTFAGFGVRVYPSGKKSFVHSYYFQGRKRFNTIGQYGILTLDMAEKRVQKQKVDLLDGINILDVRQKNSATQTIADLCGRFVIEKVPFKKSGAEDERRINRHILPRWRAFKINSVTDDDVESLRESLKNTPYEANRTLSLVAALFNFAKEKKLMDRALPNPATGIKHFQETSRERFVSHEEMPRLLEAMQNEKNQYAQYALWLYLLTGMRKSELLELRWQDIDLISKNICLLDTKNTKNHYLPLSDAAVTVINQIPRVEANPYLIVGKLKGKHLVNIDKAWNRVRAEAGMNDVRIHDLRRSVGSWLAQSGNSLHFIGRILNHKSSASSAIYARFHDDDVRLALDKHGEDIFQSVVNAKENNNVVDFVKKAVKQ